MDTSPLVGQLKATEARFDVARLIVVAGSLVRRQPGTSAVCAHIRRQHNHVLPEVVRLAASLPSTVAPEQRPDALTAPGRIVARAGMT